MTSFETIADMMATRSSSALATGLPQLDRIAPMTPGSLSVLIGPSAVGKSRIASHIAETVSSTHERGAFRVEGPTALDVLDDTLGRRLPALLIVDPLAAVTATPGLSADVVEDVAEQRPIHPAELGRIGARLRDMGQRYRLPILLCHRYTPARDSVTGLVVSTESANPLLDLADLVAVVRVQADPTHVGLEILRNRLGPITNLRVPLPLAPDGGLPREGAVRVAARPRAGQEVMGNMPPEVPGARLS